MKVYSLAYLLLLIIWSEFNIWVMNKIQIASTAGDSKGTIESLISYLEESKNKRYML